MCNLKSPLPVLNQRPLGPWQAVALVKYVRFEKHVMTSSPKWRTVYTQSSDWGKGTLYLCLGLWGLLLQGTELESSGSQSWARPQNQWPRVLRALLTSSCPEFLCFPFSFLFYRLFPLCLRPSLSFPVPSWKGNRMWQLARNMGLGARPSGFKSNVCTHSLCNLGQAVHASVILFAKWE